MLEKFAAFITKRQMEKGRISSIEQPIYEYGYILLTEVGINITISVIIGIVSRQLLTVILFIAMFVPVRKYAGGYHMKKTWHCIIATNLVVLFVVLSNKFLTEYLSLHIWIVTEIISVMIISIVSPIDTEAKPLDEDERKMFGKKARLICCFECIVFFLLLFAKVDGIASIGIMAHAILSVMLCLAKRQFDKRKTERWKS